MTKAELREIEEGMRAYFMSEREMKKLDDFDRMVTIPATANLFRLKAPEYVRKLMKSGANRSSNTSP